jgi:hypothetical protein
MGPVLADKPQSFGLFERRRQSPAPTLVTTPDATRYPTPMTPIATVVAWISAVIAVVVARIVAVAVMRISISSVSVVSIAPRANVDIDLCRCLARRKRRQSNEGNCSRIGSQVLFHWPSPTLGRLCRFGGVDGSTRLLRWRSKNGKPGECSNSGLQQTHDKLGRAGGRGISHSLATLGIGNPVQTTCQ